MLKHWRVPEEIKNDEGMVSFSVDILRDGWLGAPFSARTPWNPAAAVNDYASWPAGGMQRRVADSIYRALRDAQPLSLPPEVMKVTPLTVKLAFRPMDVR